jgi:hypothetical protein
MELRQVLLDAGFDDAGHDLKHGQLRDWHLDVMGRDDHPGSGFPREFTESQARRLVAWLRVEQVTGHKRGAQRQDIRRRAARLLAAAREGWIVLSNGQVFWSLVPPVSTLRSRCAIAIPVESPRSL